MMRTNSPTRTTGGNTTASAKFVTTRPAHVAPAPAGVVPTSPRGLLVQAKATPPEGAAAPYAVQQAAPVKETPLTVDRYWPNMFPCFHPTDLKGFVARMTFFKEGDAAGMDPKVWVRSYRVSDDGPCCQTHIKEFGGALQKVRDIDGLHEATWPFTRKEHTAWDGFHHPFQPESTALGLVPGVAVNCTLQVAGWGADAGGGPTSSEKYGKRMGQASSLTASWFCETFFFGDAAKAPPARDGEGRASTTVTPTSKTGPCRTSTVVGFGPVPNTHVTNRFHAWEPYQVDVDLDSKIDLRGLLAAAGREPATPLPTDTTNWLQPLGGNARVRVTQVRVDYGGKQLLSSSTEGAADSADASSLWPWATDKVEVPHTFDVYTYDDGAYLLAPKQLTDCLPSSEDDKGGWSMESGVMGYGGRWVRVRTTFNPQGQLERWRVLEYLP